MFYKLYENNIFALNNRLEKSSFHNPYIFSFFLQ
jgi:hypothetical protein